MVEIVLVMAIASSLFSGLFYTFNTIRVRARDNERDRDVNTMAANISTYIAKTGQLPFANKNPKGTNRGGDYNFSAATSNDINVGVVVGHFPWADFDKYIAGSVLKDPINDKNYYYNYGGFIDKTTQQPLTIYFSPSDCTASYGKSLGKPGEISWKAVINHMYEQKTGNYNVLYKNCLDFTPIDKLNLTLIK